MSTVLPARPPAQDPGPSECSVQRPAKASLKAGRGTTTERLLTFVRSIGVRDSLVMAVAMALAGGLDYGVSVLAGRWLVPVEYGIFIAVAAIL